MSRPTLQHDQTPLIANGQLPLQECGCLVHASSPVSDVRLDGSMAPVPRLALDAQMQHCCAMRAHRLLPAKPAVVPCAAKADEEGRQQVADFNSQHRSKTLVEQHQDRLKAGPPPDPATWLPACRIAGCRACRGFLDLHETFALGLNKPRLYPAGTALVRTQMYQLMCMPCALTYPGCCCRRSKRRSARPGRQLQLLPLRRSQQPPLLRAIPGVPSTGRQIWASAQNPVRRTCSSAQATWGAASADLHSLKPAVVNMHSWCRQLLDAMCQTHLETLLRHSVQTQHPCCGQWRSLPPAR